ncbi:MAG: NAD(+) diphosphatase [Actinomycetes bacterium]
MTSQKPIKLPLSMAEVDRAAHLRLDEGYLKDAWRNAQVLQFQDEKFLSNENQLQFIEGKQLGDYQSQSDYFLGVDYVESTSLNSSSERKISTHYFVRNYVNEELSVENLRTLREIGSFLSPRDIGLSVHAQGLANWHKKHPRCSQCGAATTVISGGSVRKCLIDESEHYPRTDSAIIVLVKDDQDRILLGRQKVWPKNRFSTFAGFVEPGESFEHCVVREVAEEAGINLSKINYLGSQPWPFPSSLMIAFEAVTDNPTAARPDGDEIEEIRWFSRAEMKQAIIDATLILPLDISVARQMINGWYGDDAAKDLKGAESWR